MAGCMSGKSGHQTRTAPVLGRAGGGKLRVPPRAEQGLSLFPQRTQDIKACLGCLAPPQQQTSAFRLRVPASRPSLASQLRVPPGRGRPRTDVLGIANGPERHCVSPPPLTIHQWPGCRPCKRRCAASRHAPSHRPCSPARVRYLRQVPRLELAADRVGGALQQPWDLALLVVSPVPRRAWVPWRRPTATLTTAGPRRPSRATPFRDLPGLPGPPQVRGTCAVELSSCSPFPAAVLAYRGRRTYFVLLSDAFRAGGCSVMQSSRGCESWRTQPSAYVEAADNAIDTPFQAAAASSTAIRRDTALRRC